MVGFRIIGLFGLGFKVVGWKSGPKLGSLGVHLGEDAMHTLL